MGNSLSGSVLDELGPPGGINEPMLDVVEKESDGEGLVEQEYETLDYDDNENEAYRKKFLHVSPDVVSKQLAESNSQARVTWTMHGIIGFTVAGVAMFIDYFVTVISNAKYKTIEHLIDQCGNNENLSSGCLAKPWFVLTLFNVFFVLLATMMCGLIAPESAGSGIAEIKCFLNGIKRRGWLNMRTGIVKVIGVLFSVSATMPVGKEGPMIHSGAIIGGGLPQGKTSQFGFDFNFIRYRSDQQKRDFVAAGAAAGVAVAFGAPIGGVLFAWEEGASHWYQGLTWKIFWTATSAIFFLRIYLAGTTTATGGNAVGWGNIGSGSLVDFGNFNAAVDNGVHLWTIVDFCVFIPMAIVGGLLGALWVALQKRLTQYRMRKKFTTQQRMAEACIICFVNTALMYCAAMFFGRCEYISLNQVSKTQSQYFNEETTRKFFCTDPTSYNDMATLCFNPLEEVIKHLFHFDGFFSYTTLGVSFVLLFFTSCWTYGLLIPSGLFVPALVTGSVYGRLIGEMMISLGHTQSYAGSYAVMGAAAFLGGVVRMTISLTVILLEATNEMQFAPPLMMTLMIAKWVGDQFDVGIYDVHIHLKKQPLLEWEAEQEMHRFLAADVMSKDVVTLPPVCRVSDLVTILTKYQHNGFPVVVDHESGSGVKMLGLMLRSDLITLLQNRIWGELSGDSTNQAILPKVAFLKKYPQRTPIGDVSLPVFDTLDNLWMDIQSYYNPTPFTLPPHAALPRCFKLFRSMGLRHLPIIDEDGSLVGIITRAELTSYRIHDLMHEFDKHYEESNRRESIVG